MKKRKGTKGAISVFLAIILVPCIVISSVFVDLSRVHLSKAMTSSAADLALNALLTNYDADLKEWYGMVASCQDIDQFYKVSAEYFLRTISSRGLSDAEIILLSDYYSAATNNDAIYDLLKVECKTDQAKMVSAVNGANLANASLMKDQVVEFMKYRAPIEIAEGLVSRLTSDATVVGAIEAEKNEPLVEDKQEFYQSEGELTEAAFFTYKAIYAYYVAANKAELTSEALSKSYTVFQSYKDVYKEILRYAIANLSNTSGLSKYSRYTITKTYYNDLYSNPSRNFSEVYSEKKKVDDVETYYIDLSDVKSLVDDLGNKVKSFNQAKSNFNSAAQPILNKLPYGNETNQANPIQWWVQMNKAVNASSGTNHTSEVKKAAQNMMRAYSRVLAIDNCELRGKLPKGWSSLDDWKTQYGATGLISQVESIQSTYLTAGVKKDSDAYLKAVRYLESVSSANAGNINPANLYVTVDGQRKNLNAALKHISSKLTSTRKEMQNYVDLLDKAIDGDKGDTPSLDELKTYVETYENKLDEWTSTAGSTNTTMAGQDKAEINKMEASIEIDKADVAALKTRLVNIRSQIKAVISAIDSMKWGGQAIKDITSIDTFKTKASINKSSIGTKNSEINSYRDTLFNQKFAPKTMPTMAHANDNSYSPKIDPKTKQVATPDLWVYLYSKFSGLENQMENAKNEKDEATKAKDGKAKEAQDKNRYKGGGKNVKWEYSSGEAFKLGDAVTGLIGVVKKLITLDVTGMRDDLYATTYVMEMFSYATYENEGLYHLLEEKDADKIHKLTVSDYSDDYESVRGTEETERKTWLSSDPRDPYNKSLTNKLINKANNAAYCAEVEYILCGSKDSKNEDNVKAVYNKIYAVRYGLNLVSGFQHFWSGKSATAKALAGAALAVQTMTSGLVPAAVTKAVLIPIIAVFETAFDLERLEAGFPVELYKIEDGMWFCALGDGNKPESIGDFMTAFLKINPYEKPNTGNGFFYSDYLMLFVYIGFNSSAQQGMYQRMGEVIQLNVGTLSKVSSYSMKKSQVYFQLKSELRAKPLMINLPFFSAEEYNNELDTKTDWCTYQINMVRGYN